MFKHSSSSGPWRLNTIHRSVCDELSSVGRLVLQLSLRRSFLEQKSLQAGDIQAGEILQGIGRHYMVRLIRRYITYAPVKRFKLPSILIDPNARELYLLPITKDNLSYGPDLHCRGEDRDCHRCSNVPSSGQGLGRPILQRFQSIRTAS